MAVEQFVRQNAAAAAELAQVGGEGQLLAWLPFLLRWDVSLVACEHAAQCNPPPCRLSPRFSQQLRDFSSTPLPLPQTHDVRQQARCTSALGHEEGGEQLSMVEAGDVCYLEALRACLLGGLTMEPLLLGLSDGYELCRWAGEEGCCAGVAALVVGACQAMPVHQKLIGQKLMIRCC